jgi:CP family cyanate transporter-like MFS transporter
MMSGRVWRVLVGVALAVAAFNLRPAVASIGPLLGDIRAGLPMSPTVAGLLTSVPPACFAVIGIVAPRLVRRVGPATVVWMAMAALALGLAGRALAGGSAVFLAASAAALAGIGIGNVVMPIVVKRYFPEHVGVMTGVYSMALTLGASLAAAISVPLAEGLGGGWRVGLGFWAVPAVVAALAWLVVRTPRDDPPTAATADVVPAGRITSSPTAWALSVFFGLQAAGAYIVLGWLPQIFRDAGVAPATAGLLLALTPAVGIPLAFLMPTLAARLPTQGPLAVALSALGIAGYLGLWLVPATVPWLWALLLGVSQASFPLALTMIGLRSRSTRGVAQLSAFAQGVGYLISIPGPILVGVLYDHTAGWTAPLAFMAALLVPQAVAGVLAGRDRFVESETVRA